MSNNNMMKKVFDKELNSEKMKQQILLKYERKEKNKMSKIIKYAIVPVCLVFAFFIGISFHKENNILEDHCIGTMKVYAYTMTEGEKLEKTELKDNIKLGLAKYNLAMSSVPGYPIEFELDNIDYLNIDVINGSILNWDKDTGKVDNLGNTYKLSNNGTLYFNVNINTNIKITGIKNKNKMLEKSITISSDDDFNYYATLK